MRTCAPLQKPREEVAFLRPISAQWISFVDGVHKAMSGIHALMMFRVGIGVPTAQGEGSGPQTIRKKRRAWPNLVLLLPQGVESVCPLITRTTTPNSFGVVQMVTSGRPFQEVSREGIGVPTALGSVSGQQHNRRVQREYKSVGPSPKPRAVYANQIPTWV